ncbi:hypothetical protein OF897_13255 [Chryseobacterium formosus]|uniref:Uncharacterized protein n=1 Tax=Chryseobacterium formosus TaxID=1537363 RepID=A0ABT3XT38_9FLAO|nr:hypothetical protein [Chryseobacterium formosus]MCX8524881.1 hypothetical protein [Chryseobacterium formosus]
MIFEDDPHAVVHETNNKSVSNFAIITQVIQFNGDKSFILNSLQKIKNSTICEIKRKLIDTFITEYTVNFTGYVENDSYQLHADGYQLSPSYAKQSYEKVLREQEYLNRIITTLNND